VIPIVVDTGEGEPVDCEVAGAPTATMGDLLASLGTVEPAAVDGRVVPPGQLLETGLQAGAVLATGSIPPVSGEPPRFQFQILAGPGAGMAVELTAGRHVVGSGDRADVRLRTGGVAPRHLGLEIGAGARLAAPGHGRSLDADTVLVIGQTLACVAPAPEPARCAATTARPTIPFNRRPRPTLPAPDPAIILPDPPAGQPAPRRMGWVALAAPVLFGIVMAVAIDPRMALFALLGPVVMVGGRIDDRRLLRRTRRLNTERIGTEAAALGATLQRRRLGELRRRRTAHPSVATLAWWVRGRSSRVWERRPGDPDFLRLVAGYGKVRWRPPLIGDPESIGGAVVEAVTAHTELGLAPVTVDMASGTVLGIAGDRSTALDLARGLTCQAAALHGPSDLRVAVVTDRPGDWAWAKWLPHTMVGTGDGRRLLAGDPVETAAVLDRIGLGLGAEDHRPVVLVVIDRGQLSDPDGVGLRRLLAGSGVAAVGIVVAATEDELPSECTEVALVEGHRARLTVDGKPLLIAVAGAVDSVAAGLARSLAGLSDPDLVEAGSDLPGSVRLLDLIGASDPTADTLIGRWQAAGDRPEAVIGVTDTGPLRIDLTADGPHGLLAGTTGSGKSELLRTLVAALAMQHGPDRLTFVLVDYKGGSAFDAAAALPHTVGLVTDLDDGLAARALRCLEAELRHRERRLRALGAPDLDSFLRFGGRLPRMLIVVDEFAALARELPRFVESLIDIAARGRSLGVHLLLATQRPAGVVGEAIRANTNIRIALRVTDRADSVDVLGDPAAAAIGRRMPGRGLVRLGPGEIVAFQAAMVSTGGSGSGRSPVTIRPFRFAHEQRSDRTGDDRIIVGRGTAGPTDLERVAAAANEAVMRLGMEAPRRPWPEPLPDRIMTEDLPHPDDDRQGAVAVGLADEPDRQRMVTFTWSPEDGSLGLYGVTGCGLTTALETIVLGLASAPDPRHLYIVDGGGDLASLARLARVGAVVSPLEGERMARMLRMLLAEIDRRRSATGDEVTGIVLVIDGLEAVLRSVDGPVESTMRDRLIKVIAEGPGAGIVTVFATPRPAGLPAVAEAAVANRLLFRQADPIGAAVFGVRGVDALPPGRAIHALTGRTVQVAVAGPVAAAAAAMTGRDRPPPPVGMLTDDVSAADVDALLEIGTERWTIPIGIGDRELAPVGVRLSAGDHLLIAGGARSGKSTLLAAVASVVRRRAGDVRVLALASGSSPLGAIDGVELLAGAADLGDLVDGLLGADDPVLIVIDEGDDLPGTEIGRLVTTRHPGLHMVAAVRPEVKTVYDHWARAMGGCRLGVWLRPSAGVDADLWRTPLPRRLPARVPPGRGLLVADGGTELVQVMRP